MRRFGIRLFLLLVLASFENWASGAEVLDDSPGAWEKPLEMSLRDDGSDIASCGLFLSKKVISLGGSSAVAAVVVGRGRL